MNEIECNGGIEPRRSDMPGAVRIWVWICAYLNGAGWALSAVHQLTAAGYAVALLIGMAVLCAWKLKTSGAAFPRVRWRKYRCRFRRPFPLAFLILAAMAFLGGVLYAPSNYDALSYRIPRVLHWLAVGQWHWIHTIFPCLNTRSCGIEWVSAPVIALLKTARPLFLINMISFLLLPGLVFSVFTRLGVRRQVAWPWMWIVPTGYGLLLQAGSLGNDLFGATFALAAVDFALRAKVSRSAHDFFASVLAAAMMTSAKTGNLPLLLPWAVAIFPSIKLVFRWPLKTSAVCALAIFASALPTMVLNGKFCGDWSGEAPETVGLKNDPAFQAGANTVLLTIENFVPPVFPLAEKWNQTMERVIPPELGTRLQQTIMRPDCQLQLDEMQIEENAGLGFGVSILLLISVAATMFVKRRSRPTTAWATWQTCVRLAPLVSLVALMTQSHRSIIGRLMVSYYALLLPPFLACAGHERLVKKGWWRAAVFAVLFMAAGLLIVSPARPLFPVLTILGKIQTRVPDSKLLSRVEEVYLVYRERPDAFAPVRAILPPDAGILGMVTSEDPETSLWYPFGSRRIEHVCPEDTAADLKRQGIKYVLARGGMFGESFGGSRDDWLKRMNAQVVWKIPLNLRASRGALDWYLVKLR